MQENERVFLTAKESGIEMYKVNEESRFILVF